MKRIRELIEIAQFNYEKKYRLLAFFFCPFYLMRRNLYENIKYFAPKLNGSILDFGCGSKPYKNLFYNCSRYDGVDIEQEGHLHQNEQIDFFYDGRILPFEDDQYDNIFSSEVIEHIENIDEVFDELYRVLKPGGSILITTPFVWNENEIPYDYARYTSYGIEKLLIKHGFGLIELRKSMNFIEIIYQMKAEYYRKKADESRFRLVRCLVKKIIVPTQILKGILLGRILPKDMSLYGNNIIYAIKEG